MLNARTGSVVILNDVGDARGLVRCRTETLTVTITTTPVDQPAGNAAVAVARTVQAERSDISVNAAGLARVIHMAAGTKLTDVVKALNTLGATPLDLLAILQAMKSAGALHADIEVI